MRSIEAILFDAYGTLFDTRSAVTRHAARLAGKTDQVAAVWRLKQIEYTWNFSLRGEYHGFDKLVRAALDYALADAGLPDRQLADDVMAAFATLTPFDDAASTLRHLKQRGMRPGILSNGTPAMLARLVEDHAFAADLDPIVSVEPARIFKPSAKVYQLGVDALKLPPEKIGFVSGNAWDAAGAAGFGFHVFWINRAGQPVEYGLAERATTITALADLTKAIA